MRNAQLVDRSELSMAQIPEVSLGCYDPHGVTRFLSTVLQKPQNMLLLGKVIMYHPSTHSAAVRVKNDTWPCIFADEMLSFSFGFSETNPPREGDNVLVMASSPGSRTGIVIGRLPFPMDFKADGGTGDKYNDPDKYNRQSFTQVEDSRDINIPSYSKPVVNKKDKTTKLCTNLRPTDVYPGEYANLNQHNCGIKGGLFSSTLVGGGASLRLSALTNCARLTCDSYRRHSLLGNMHEFHNGRYLSSERDIAMYQEERLGGAEREAGVWTDDSKAPVAGENQTIRPRIKELSGYFGHLYSRFCMRPSANVSSIRVLGDEEKEEGVCRETIDPSGQYRLSASGMIAIERTGRIPVPVRTAYPTDKDHDIESDPETLKPFKHDQNSPDYRQLELYDRLAYDLKNQYSRIDGEKSKTPDYYVPQEEEMEPLKDAYDENFTGSETVKLKEFDKRRAGVYIGEDGSVIIRDAWGSEIAMLAGNVTISCAGNVMMLPGKTQLTIAGDDIVQKAQNSIDIHASEHDIRLSAARNMEIVGGADENSHKGGVIIESKGSSSTPWDGKDKGESAQVSGITLKAKKQAVVMDGQDVVVRSRKRTRILSGEKELDGEIGMGAKKIRSRTSQGTYITNGEKAHVAVEKENVVVSAGRVDIAGEDSTSIYKGEDYMIPLKWFPVENMAAIKDPLYDALTKELVDENKSSLGFDSESLDKMVFGFRTSAECATTSSWAIGGSGKWKMYEPAWVQVKGIYDTLRNGGVDTEAYKEDGEWDNGRPFPGKEAENDGVYAQLSGLAPKNLTSEGFNKSRKSVEDSSSVEEASFNGGYLVRKSS